MAQTRQLLNTLKKVLRTHGLKYRDVARRIGLSEASVKRLFSEERLALDRLDQICHLMGLEISDVVRQMEVETRQLTELTESQEKELVSDEKLLLVAFLVVNGFTFSDIQSFYSLSDTELVRCLAILDKLKLIELLPKNRIKLLLSPHFTWRRNGPIQKFFMSKLQEDYFRSKFDRSDEVLKLVSGMLSHTSVASLIRKLEKIAADFNEMNQEDRQLPLQKRLGYSMILAIRPWRPEVFRKWQKN
jgi:DNA-binding Xre family transcriptional regulator